MRYAADATTPTSLPGLGQANQAVATWRATPLG